MNRGPPAYLDSGTEKTQTLVLQKPRTPPTRMFCQSIKIMLEGRFLSTPMYQNENKLQSPVHSKCKETV